MTNTIEVIGASVVATSFIAAEEGGLPVWILLDLLFKVIDDNTFLHEVIPPNQFLIFEIPVMLQLLPKIIPDIRARAAGLSPGLGILALIL